MTSVARWTTPGAWTAAFGTELNSLASANVAVSTVVIANGSGLDQYVDVSFSLVGTTPSTGAPYFALYLLPLNQDGTTYGDGTASGATAPSGTYQVASIMVPLSKTAVALLGMARRIEMPPGSFKFALGNFTSNALSTTNTCQYRVYDENLNG